MFQEKRSKRSRWKNRNNLSFLFVVLLALGFIGCNEIQVQEATSNRPYIHKADEFLPLNAGQTEAVFWSDGTKNDYTLKTWVDGTKTTFQAVSEKMVVDEEIYEVRDSQISLRRAAWEDFVEPVPLLKFPLRLGDEYKWKGTLACSEEKHKGEATVITSGDFVRLKDKSQEAVKVEINLRIDEGAPRKLSFWFVKGMGVLKTEMGKNVREPKI